MFLLACTIIGAVGAADTEDGVENADTAAMNAVDDSYVSAGESEMADTSAGTFEDLNNLIVNANENSTITLDKNYSYTYPFDFKNNGITIGKSLTIEGNGFTISGDATNSLLTVSADNVVLNNITFKCSSSRAILWTGDNGTLTNSYFTNGYEVNGGAVMWNGANGAIKYSVFTDNNATKGGAVYWDGVNGTIDNCDFIRNTASQAGGAVYWNNVNGTVINSRFINSTAAGSDALFESKKGNIIRNENNQIIGSNINDDEFTRLFMNLTDNSQLLLEKDYNLTCGPVYITVSNVIVDAQNHLIDANQLLLFYITGDNVVLKNFRITNCTGNYAIYWMGDGGLLINTNVTNNFAGFMAWYGANGSMDSCNFEEITGVGDGLVYWIGENGTVINSNFKNSVASSSSAAIFYDANYGIIDNCTFINCNLTGSNNHWRTGGAVQIRGSYVTISNSYFADCNAVMSGAALSIRGDNITVDTCDFVNCNVSSSSYGGGAVLAMGDDNRLINCNFINNSALNGKGGAILIAYDYGAATSIIGDSLGGTVIDNCSFYGNQAKYGGAVYTYGLGVNITNSNFRENNATRGGAIYNDNEGTVIVNCTFKDDDAVDYSAYYSTKPVFLANNTLNDESSFENGTLTVTDFYISPNGEGIGTLDDPCNWTYAYSNIASGKTIYFTQGVYTDIINQTISKSLSLVGLDDVTIDLGGNGFAFRVKSQYTTVKNINFINGYDSAAATLNWDGPNGVLDNCTFINNSGTYGAILLNSYLTINNSEFINNTGSVSGAINRQNGGRIDKLSNSIFINNTGASYNDIYPNTGCIYYNNTFYGSYIKMSTEYVEGYDYVEINVIADNEYRNLDLFIDDELYDTITLKANTTGNIIYYLTNLTSNEEHTISFTLNGDNTYYTEDKKFMFLGEYMVYVSPDANGIGTLDNPCNWTYAIENYEGGTIVLLNGTFTNISSDLATDRMHITGSGNTFIDGNGSRIFNVLGNGVIIENINFINAKSIFGAIYWTGSSGNLSYCTFENCCSTSRSAGAVFWSSANGVINKCNFTNCKATASGNQHGGGGAIHINAHVEVNDCNFINCSSVSYGGAIHLQSGSPEIRNCTFINCSSNQGGAIHVHTQNAVIYYSTFIDNKATANGGAIFVSSESTSNELIFSCVFMNNTATTGGAVCWYSNNNGELLYSNFTNNTANTYNDVCYNDKLVINNNNFVGDYLRIGDKYITKVTHNATIDNIPTNTDVIASIMFNDTVINITLPNEKVFDFAGLPDGIYDVSVKFTSTNNNSYVSNVDKTVTLIYQEIFYVGVDTNGTGTMDDPCNITYALEQASIGSLIILLNGTHNIGGVTVSTDALEITGSGNTTINQNGLNHIGITGKYVLMKNITFTKTSQNSNRAIYWAGSNGNLTDCNFINYKSSCNDGGAVYWANNGIISNCTFINVTGSSSNQIHGGGAIYINSGKVLDSYFENCYLASGNYGGAIYTAGTVEISGCTFNECRATHGSAIRMRGSLQIHNNTFINNSNSAISGYSAEGSFYGANIYNNTFINNTAFVYGSNTRSAIIKFHNNTLLSSKISPINDYCNVSDNWYGTNTPDLITIQGKNTSYLVVKCDRIYDELVCGYWNNILDIYFVRNGTDEVVNSVVRPVNYTINEGDIYIDPVTGTFKIYSINTNPVNISLKVDNQDLGDFIFNSSDNEGFIELQNLIKGARANDTLILNNFTYSPEYDGELADGVVINKTITIALNESARISGNNIAKSIFNIISDDVLLENITIKDVNGTAINAFGDNIQINNLTAENINDTAIEVTGDNAVISNVNLVEHDGVAIKVTGDNATIRNIDSSLTDEDIIVNGTINIDVTVDDVVYPDAATVIVNAGVDGTYIAKVKGKDYAVTVKNGTGSAVLDVLPAYTYDVNVSGQFGEDTPVSNASTTFAVINITLPEIVANKTTKVPVNLPADATGNISVLVNGKTVDTKELINGSAVLEIPELEAGLHNITISYSGNDEHNEFSKTFDTAVKVDTGVNITLPEILENETTEIPVDLPADVTGNVSVIVDGEVVDSQELVNGSAILEIPELDAGHHNISIVYPGDDKYASFNLTSDVPVKVDGEFNVTVPDLYENVTAEIPVDLPSDATGNVSVIVDGEVADSQELVNGSAILEIPPLSKGEHNISVIYPGDDKYASQTDEYNITVADDLIITSNNLTKYYSAPERFIITVTDSKGNPFTNKTVTITLNGRDYIRHTDENGSANLAINLYPGVYDAVVTADNVTFNHTISVLSTVNGTDIVKFFRNGTQYYATFRDADGNYLANGTAVEFNINGVLYTRYINGNEGLAKLNINLHEGEYIITASNLKTGEMSSNTIKVLSKLNASDIQKYYRNGTQYTVLVLDDNGNPVGAGVEVKFNINGVFYTRKTDSNGVAKLNINLLEGNYTITTEYEGCLISNNIEVLPVLITDDLIKQEGSSCQFVVTVLDNQGQHYAGQTVSFNINGVFYNSVSDADGHAKLNINLPYGKYIITSSYNGCSIANDITVTY